MPFALSRRLRVAARAFFAPLVPAVNAGEPAPRPPVRGSEPAEVVNDPRAYHVDIGPPDAPWRVFVGLPAMPPPPEGYSAIIASDGNATFPLLWHARERLAPAAPLAVIGIGYPDGRRFDVVRRWYDLTSRHRIDPKRQGIPPRGPGDRETGGREAFAQAIEGMILPELARCLPLARNDLTLYGHSLGGLFTLHMLFTRPKLFARFSAADPSLWWNDGEALREAAAFAGGLSAGGGAAQERALRLLVESSGALRRDSGAGLNKVEDLQAVLARFAGVALDSRSYPEESHISLLPPSIADTIRFHLGQL